LLALPSEFNAGLTLLPDKVTLGLAQHPTLDGIGLETLLSSLPNNAKGAENKGVYVISHDGIYDANTVQVREFCFRLSIRLNSAVSMLDEWLFLKYVHTILHSIPNVSNIFFIPSFKL
jgi:hypothetical protein